MLQILANDDPTGAVGKPAVLRSGLGSILFHMTVLVVLVSLQFYNPAILPERFTRIALVAPAPPPPPPPPALIKASRAVVSRPARVFVPVLSAPVAIPQHAAQLVTIADAPSMDTAGVIGGIPGGIPGGVPGGVIGGVIPAVLPPPPPPPPPVAVRAPEPPPAPATPSRIRVDSGIQEAKLVNMVHPVYPEVAKQARIQGDVRLTAVIDREGKITELKVISGNPLLIDAARNAVTKWRYQPTLLHGEAVEVITDIVVQFHLRPVG